ncbi:hypothetical protein NDU88_000614 [Pleurodeles waltl]|uniref:Uncharacterized protein n=1 Tax=Pleurodeles waltl TaxID=8319 RepID=A0AAV7NA18_PLEWA|nr:hypothetical protein NDU88_000614 [Pleurodeles waltl]
MGGQEPTKPQMKVQNGCLRMEEAEDSSTTKGARNFFFMQKMLHGVLEDEELFLSLAKDCKQALLAAKVAVQEKGCCPGPGRTRMSPLGREDRGGPLQHREPTQKQAAPEEALEHRFKKTEHGVISTLQKRVPRSRRSTQGDEQCRTECWGPGLGCA